MAKASTQTGLTVTVTMLEKVYETGRKCGGIQGVNDDRLRQGLAKMELPRDPQQIMKPGSYSRPGLGRLDDALK